ncbi:MULTISPECIES: hypothetical protein [Burkholderia]|uniref:hypothetical protein n=1 Tax=Burkholderia TaxID=32008 RepID=UPI000841FF56|nr:MULTISPECIES: hypothetical protein [unclassified Burkholderia]AOK32147.1 hypothetical protein AQ611_22070 [Burkholderia sp. Bp7605]
MQRIDSENPRCSRALGKRARYGPTKFENDMSGIACVGTFTGSLAVPHLRAVACCFGTVVGNGRHCNLGRAHERCRKKNRLARLNVRRAIGWS